MRPVPAVEAVNPSGPDQAYDTPPDAVKVVDCPEHIEFVPVMLQEGSGFTTNVTEQELVQPFEAVTVTV